MFSTDKVERKSKDDAPVACLSVPRAPSMAPAYIHVKW